MSVVAILIVLGAAAAWPAVALAGPARYVLEKCDPALPGGGVEGAVFHGAAPFYGGDNCQEVGGSIFVVQGGEAGTSAGYWTLPLPAPPGGYTESVTVTGSMCNGAYSDHGTVAFAVEPGWALNCTQQTHNFAIDSPEGNAGLVYVGCEGACAGAPEAWAADFAATEVDPLAPTVQSLVGTLIAGGQIRGTQSIGAIADDQGGGVADMTLRVDGEPVEPARAQECATVRVANPSYVGIVATKATPCPPRAEANWSVDTATYPFREGLNEVTVCAQDFATIGTPNEGCLSTEVDVDNSCAESTVVGGEVLSAGFKDSGSETLALPYGKGASVAGALTDSAHDPVPGATICIETMVQGSAGPPTPVATADTDAHGHFTYKVAAGPDRQILVGYRHGSFQIEHALSIDVHARPRLNAAPRKLRNGERVRLRGRLPEPRAAGRVVVLQAAVPGSHRWITFRKATTGERGRFKASYHFVSTTRKITYHFRALVPRQAGYPWYQGESKPVAVTVRRWHLR